MNDYESETYITNQNFTVSPENKELVNLESTDQKKEILAPDDGE